MEFLMTYGWAILVIVIIVAVLFAMGVMDPNRASATSCVFAPGFACYSLSIAQETGALTLDAGQAFGGSIEVTAISCSENESVRPGASTWSPACPECGDGFCTGDETEDNCCNDCAAECGPTICMPMCGDEFCDPLCERYETCHVDCPLICGGENGVQFNPVYIPSGEHRYIAGSQSGNVVYCTDGNGEPFTSSDAEFGGRYKGNICVGYTTLSDGLGHTVCGGAGTAFETAIPVSGEGCAPSCLDGTVCTSGSQCLSGECNASLICQPCYSNCPDGYPCDSDSDCASGWCDNGVCKATDPYTLTECGVIDAPGTYTLSPNFTQPSNSLDLVPSCFPEYGDSACICITSDDVTLNCNGGTIGSYVPELGAREAYGVGVYQASGVAVTGCTLNRWYVGLYAYGYDGITFSGNQVDGSEYGMELDAYDQMAPTSGISITGNTVTNSASFDLYLYGIGGGTVSGNTFGGTSAPWAGAVNFDYASNLVVSNNEITSGSIGMAFFDAGGPNEGNTFTGNNIGSGVGFDCSSGLTGVNLDSGDNTCSVNKNCSWVTSCGGCAEGGLVSACPCTLDTAGSYGLSDDLTLGYASDCILITASDVTLDCGGKTITGPAGSGYGVYLGGVSGATVSNCVVNGFMWGISVDNSDYNSITGNTVSSNSNCGISLYSADYNGVMDNNASSNSDKGICLEGSSYNNVTGNTASSNLYGISIATSSNGNNLTGNTANSNPGGGIRIVSSSNNNLTLNSISNSGYRDIYCSFTATDTLRVSNICATPNLACLGCTPGVCNATACN